MTDFKDYIGNKDIKWWDGVVRAFTRLTSTGGTLSQNKIGHYVDVLEAYGGGANYTTATLQSAISAVGTVNKVTFVLQPGTWTVTSNITASRNIHWVLPAGAVFAISTGITLTISGTIEAGRYQIFSLTGTGVAAPSTLQTLYPEWWGAVGDGATDDSAAVQAAGDVIESNGHLHLSAGKSYSITSLIITSGTDFVIDGTGELAGSDETLKVLYLNGCTDFVVRDIRVKHSTSTVRNSTSSGIWLNGCSRFTIDSTWIGVNSGAGIILGADDGVIGKGNGPCYDGTICNNWVTTTLADGIHITGKSERINVVGNKLHTTGDDSIAVVSYQADTDWCKQIQITGNVAFQCKTRGITVLGGEQIEIVGNSVRNTAAAGIYVENTTTFNTYQSQYITIDSNTVQGANTYNSPVTQHASIQVISQDASYKSKNINITNNILIEGQEWGIQVGHASAVYCENIRISGNMIIKHDNATTGYGAGISAIYCNNLWIENNYIYQSSEEGIKVLNTNTGVVHITGNTVEDCNQDQTAGIDGIVCGSNNAIVKNNTILDPNAYLDTAITISGTTGCILKDNKADALSIGGVAYPTFADGDTTPDISADTHFTTANTAPTTITGFDKGYARKRIFVFVNDNNTTLDFTSTTLKGHANADWTCISGDHFRADYDGTNWWVDTVDIS